MSEHHSKSWISNVPLSLSSSNFVTYKLVKTNQNKLKIRPTKGMLFLVSIFFFVGIGVLYIVSTKGDFFTLFIGLLFTVVGFLGFSTYFSCTEIDLETLSIRVPHPTPPSRFGTSDIKFENIKELQIIEKEVRSSGEFDYDHLAYELNLVLNSGARLNLIDHSGKNEVQKDGKIISSLIGKPLSEHYVH